MRGDNDILDEYFEAARNAPVERTSNDVLKTAGIVGLAAGGTILAGKTAGAAIKSASWLSLKKGLIIIAAGGAVTTGTVVVVNELEQAEVAAESVTELTPTGHAYVEPAEEAVIPPPPIEEDSVPEEQAPVVEMPSADEPEETVVGHEAVIVAGGDSLRLELETALLEHDLVIDLDSSDLFQFEYEEEDELAEVGRLEQIYHAEGYDIKKSIVQPYYLRSEFASHEVKALQEKLKIQGFDLDISDINYGPEGHINEVAGSLSAERFDDAGNRLVTLYCEFDEVNFGMIEFVVHCNVMMQPICFEVKILEGRSFECGCDH